MLHELKAWAGEPLVLILAHSLCLLAPGGCPRPRAWFGAPGPPLLQHVSSVAISWLCSLSSALGSDHLLLLQPRPVRAEGWPQPAHVLVSRPHLALRATGGWPSPAAPELMHAVCGRRDVPPAATPTHPGPGSEIARPMGEGW